MGFGHGAFGHGPCGHGPWVIYPLTPDASYSVERVWPMEAVRFADQTEQRIRMISGRHESMLFPYTLPDSSTYCAVRSWVGALGGGARRIVVRDPRTDVAFICRLAENGLEIAPRGRVVDGIQLRWDVERRAGHAYEVRVTSAATLLRFGEAIGATSLHDSGAIPAHASITQGGSLGQPGMVRGDRATAMYCVSAVAVQEQTAVGSWVLRRGIGIVIQPTWPPPTFARQPLYAFAANGVTSRHVVFALNSYGEPQVTLGTSVVVTASGFPLTDNRPHHLAYVMSGGITSTAHALVLDGQEVATTTSFAATSFGVASVTLFGIPSSGQYYTGLVQDLIIWRGDLSGLGVPDIPGMIRLANTVLVP